MVSRTWEILFKIRQPVSIQRDLRAKRHIMSYIMPQYCGSVLVGLSSKWAKMQHPTILTWSLFKDFVSDLKSLVHYLDSETDKRSPKINIVNAFVRSRQRGKGEETFGDTRSSDHQPDGKKCASGRIVEIEKEIGSIMPEGMHGMKTFGHLLQSLTSADLDENLELIMTRHDTTKFLNSVLFNGMLYLELMR